MHSVSESTMQGSGGCGWDFGHHVQAGTTLWIGGRGSGGESERGIVRCCRGQDMLQRTSPTPMLLCAFVHTTRLRPPRLLRNLEFPQNRWQTPSAMQEGQFSITQRGFSGSIVVPDFEGLGCDGC